MTERKLNKAFLGHRYGLAYLRGSICIFEKLEIYLFGSHSIQAGNLKKEKRETLFSRKWWGWLGNLSHNLRGDFRF